MANFSELPFSNFMNSNNRNNNTNIKRNRYIKNYIKIIYNKNVSNFKNKINKEKNIKNNNKDNSNCEKKICLFHCGNIEIFEEIINKYPKIKDFYLIITYYNKKYYEILNNYNLKKFKLVKVLNKGADCGPMLFSLNYLLNNSYLYDNNTLFYKIHTKSIEKWRNNLIEDMLNFNIKNIDNNDFKKPFIFGSNKYIYSNIKGVNYKKIVNIYKRNENYKNINDYFDIYYDEFVNGKSINKFTDLVPSLNFYKLYEPDLFWINDLKHWYNYGINEFHRKSNVNYINKFAKYCNKFVAGTIFGFNKLYLDLFKDYDLKYEYKILESKFTKNFIETKIHAWEYYFGLLIYLHNGKIFGIDKNNLVVHNKYELSKKIKYSIINNSFNKSKIAFFLPLPGENPDSGGYRTLLKYINILNINGYVIDIYFGMSYNKKETYFNTLDINKYGMPSCKNWLKEKDTEKIYKIINNIKKYNEINISKNNYFLGLRCQKNYKIIFANAWQIANSVYNNKKYSKNLIYIIQDREELFYPYNYDLQTEVLTTFKKDYKYFCITKYLGNYFERYTTPENIFSSIMGVNLKIYKNLNYKRINSVVIPYYGDIKPRRCPSLVRKIIKILSKNNINCYIYPESININNNNVFNLGLLTEKQLNSLYNEFKVGIIFSNSNPSRLGFEMYASGLSVIEYDSIFTKYDMPDKYFTKINNEKNIVNIVKQLFNKKFNYNDYNEFLQEIDINKDFNNFLQLIEKNIK